jgi:hypothetical protein
MPPITKPLLRTRGCNPLFSQLPRLEAEINQLVYQLYGLTPEEVAVVEGRG